MRKTLAWVCVALGGMSACAPDVLPLGDEPLSGNAGSGKGNSAGGKSVLPGSGGTAQVDPPSEGGATLVDPPVEGGATLVDPPIEGGATQDCFAPQHMPQLAIEPGAVGCPCNGEPEECVRTQYRGGPWDVALYCVDGRWQSAEDGICASGAACVVDGVEYPSGARRVPDPYSCNKCDCTDGNVGGCTEINCPAPCPEGTFAARNCLACGLAGGCTKYEVGCFADPDCEDGLCGARCF